MEIKTKTYGFQILFMTNTTTDEVEEYLFKTACHRAITILKYDFHSFFDNDYDKSFVVSSLFKQMLRETIAELKVEVPSWLKKYKFYGTDEERNSSFNLLYTKFSTFAIVQVKEV